MPANIGQLLSHMEEYLFSLEHVFATVQWGGKAYKLPDTKGNKAKPKLFIFSTLGNDDQGEYLHAEFKLPLDEASNAVEKFDWLQTSTFGTWGKNGWCSAYIRNKRQLNSLLKLFAITYNSLPKPNTEDISQKTSESKVTPSKQKNATSSETSSPIARKIDRIMNDVTLPPDDDSFDSR